MEITTTETKKFKVYMEKGSCQVEITGSVIGAEEGATPEKAAWVAEVDHPTLGLVVEVVEMAPCLDCGEITDSTCGPYFYVCPNCWGQVFDPEVDGDEIIEGMETWGGSMAVGRSTR